MDITRAQILAGEDFVLTATDATSDLLFEWVLSNPKEAYAIARADREPFSPFMITRTQAKPFIDDGFFERHGIPVFPLELSAQD